MRGLVWWSTFSTASRSVGLIRSMDFPSPLQTPRSTTDDCIVAIIFVSLSWCATTDRVWQRITHRRCEDCSVIVTQRWTDHYSDEGPDEQSDQSATQAQHSSDSNPSAVIGRGDLKEWRVLGCNRRRRHRRCCCRCCCYCCFCSVSLDTDGTRWQYLPTKQRWELLAHPDQGGTYCTRRWRAFKPDWDLLIGFEAFAGTVLPFGGKWTAGEGFPEPKRPLNATKSNRSSLTPSPLGVSR